MVNAYEAAAAKEELQKTTYDHKLGANDVLIKVSHCGICHSDVHLADGDWGDVFPLIPGHEIVGEVAEVGSEVKTVASGDVVGVGWQCDSCGSCEWCETGDEVLCAKEQATCMGHRGGFGDHVVTNERFAIPIPKGLDPASAAPLLCGGATVYTPLKEYAKVGSHVAVIGIGGLGHMALQFAKAMGCTVTAISTSPDKEVAAREFGADHFVAKPEENTYDVILNTTHAELNTQQYIGALRPRGVFVQLGARTRPIMVGAMSLIPGYKKVVGSAIASPSGLRDMLELAAEKNVKAQIEVMPMSKVNEAMDLTRTNKARYRIVLENDF